MIKIEASQRLKVTAIRAKPAQAKAYLQSLGIKVGNSLGDAHGAIWFGLKPDAVKKAEDALTEQFGAPKQVSWNVNKAKGLKWALDDNRGIILKDSGQREVKYTGFRWTIHLVDRDAASRFK